MQSGFDQLTRQERILSQAAAILLLLCLVSLPAQAQKAFTKYAQMAAQIRRDCGVNPNALHAFTIGSAAVSHRPILLVRVTAAAPDASPGESPRLMVICRQHGDEPVSTQAALVWLARCAALSNRQLRQALGSTTVYIVPMANPDGADKLQRFNGASGDMNRDWGQFALPETRALYAAFKQISPDAVIDMHSWDLTDLFQANSVEAGMVMSPSRPLFAQAAEQMQSSIIESIRSATRQPVSELSYSPEADNRLCHRFLAARGVPAVLVETSAGPCDSSGEMASRVRYDLAALDGAIQATPHAAIRLSSSVQPSLLLASADALAGRPHQQAIGRARFTAAQLALARTRAVRLALALYLAACLVLLATGGRALVSALRRLLSRRQRTESNGGYVSIRARHYPAEARFTTGQLIAAGMTRRGSGIRSR